MNYTEPFSALFTTVFSSVHVGWFVLHKNYWMDLDDPLRAAGLGPEQTLFTFGADSRIFSHFL